MKVPVAPNPAKSKSSGTFSPEIKPYVVMPTHIVIMKRETCRSTVKPFLDRKSVEVTPTIYPKSKASIRCSVE